MRNKIWWKIFFFAILAILVSTPSHAFYVKKVVIGPFKNPVGWDKPYDPGNIFKKSITQELIANKRIQLVSISEGMKGAMNNPSMMGNHAGLQGEDNLNPGFLDFEDIGTPKVLFIQGSMDGMDRMNKMDSMPKTMKMEPTWPTKMGRETQSPSMTKIRGTVLKFEPDQKMMKSTGSTSMGSLEREMAEIQIHVEIVQNKTGRTLFEKTFKATSRLGNRPFLGDEINSAVSIEKPEFSSMKYAVDRLRREIGEFITEKLDSVLLEGEGIAINKKEIKNQSGKIVESEEEILVNLGKVNGVRIGDLLEVHAISLGLHDPFSGNDLGDIYVRTGVIKVLHAWDGFSKAVSLGGMNFKKGFLVRAVNSFRKENNSSSTKKFIAHEEEKAPWWEFHGNRTVN